MKYLTIAFSVLLFFFSALSMNGQETPFQKINKLLIEVDSLGPGVIIGVVKDQKLIHTVAKGMANLDYNIPISEVSNFRLSSSSKQFTAACVVHLVEKNKLTLDDPLSKYFPEFAPTLGKVTIAELLHHTSGIRDYMSLLMLKESRQMDFFNSFIGEGRDIYELFSKQVDLSFESGSKHSYSNTNYWLLSQVVEKASGVTLGEYAQENIFTPLGMETTCFLENEGKIVPNRVAAYVSPCPDCERLEYRYQSASVGDGGVVSSVHDLLLWENEFHQHRVFSDQFWDLMLTKGTLKNGEEISYASGLIVEEYKGSKIVKHSGMNPGYSSQIVRFPEHHLSVIVLGNQNWYDTQNYALRVADIFLPVDEETQPVKEIEALILEGEILNRFCGDYHYKETHELRTIEKKGHELFYIRNNGPTSKLIPISEHELIFEDRPFITLAFTFDEDGTKHILFQSPQGNQHAESHTPFQLEPSALFAYASEYRSTELDKTVKVEIENGTLMLHILNQQLPMQAIELNQFSAMMFTLSFEKDAAGEVSHFRMDAPRAEQILFEKF